MPTQVRNTRSASREKSSTPSPTIPVRPTLASTLFKNRLVKVILTEKPKSNRTKKKTSTSTMENSTPKKKSSTDQSKISQEVINEDLRIENAEHILESIIEENPETTDLRQENAEILIELSDEEGEASIKNMPQLVETNSSRQPQENAEIHTNEDIISGSPEDKSVNAPKLSPQSEKMSQINGRKQSKTEEEMSTPKEVSLPSTSSTTKKPKPKRKRPEELEELRYEEDDLTDSSETSTASKQRKVRNKAAQEILEHPDVIAARERLQLLIQDSEEELKASQRSSQAAKSITAILVAATTLARTTRLPATVLNIVVDALTVANEQALELECRLQYAEARIETMKKSSPGTTQIKKPTPITISTKSPAPLVNLAGENQAGHPQRRNMSRPQEGQRALSEESVYEIVEEAAMSPAIEVPLHRRRDTRPPQGTRPTYNSIIEEATSTLLFKDRGARSALEVENQLRSSNLIKNHEVKNWSKIRNGIKVTFHDAKQAMNIKSRIENNPINETIQVQRAGVKKRKIMIFHILQKTRNEEVTEALINALGLEERSNEELNNIIQFSKPVENKKSFHQGVILPEEMAKYLLKRRNITIGFKLCPVKPFVTIIRCTNCQQYDHVAAECRFERVCANCSGNHETERCERRVLRCINCTEYNHNTALQTSTPTCSIHANAIYTTR